MAPTSRRAGTAQTVPESSKRPMLLARGLTYMGLGKYARRFEKCGYDDLDALHSLDEENLKTVAARAGMAPQDRLKFLKGMLTRSRTCPAGLGVGEPLYDAVLPATQKSEPALISSASVQDLGLMLNGAASSVLSASLDAGHWVMVASKPHRRWALRASRDAAYWAVEASRAPRERALQASLDAGQWAVESSRVHRERALQMAWDALEWTLQSLLQLLQQAHSWARDRGSVLALEAAQKGSVLALDQARKLKEAVLLYSGYANEGLHALLNNLLSKLDNYMELAEADSDSEDGSINDKEGSGNEATAEGAPPQAAKGTGTGSPQGSAGARAPAQAVQPKVGRSFVKVYHYRKNTLQNLLAQMQTQRQQLWPRTYTRVTQVKPQALPTLLKSKTQLAPVKTQILPARKASFTITAPLPRSVSPPIIRKRSGQ